MDAEATPAPEPPPLIASRRHTIILLVILAGIAAYAASAQKANAPHPLAERGSMLPTYLGLIAAEWGLFRYVLVGIRRHGTPVRELLGEQWKGPGDVARDIVLAAAFWGLWLLGSNLLAKLIGQGSMKELSPLLPRGPAESAVWIALSVSAGFCEEFVYRGYLQRQIAGLTGSTRAAILAQAVIFGGSHAYQGWHNVAFIAVYGLLFGLLAWWRRSLRPGMILHAWTDVAGGLLQKSF